MGKIAGLFAALIGTAASAQDSYPTRPITLVVPWPAGAGTDIVHRAAARLAEKELGTPIVVVNKPGAAGVIGAKEIESARPDGYVLGGIASTVLLTQYTAANPTDWAKYEPIATLTYDPAGLAVRADSKWRTLGDFLREAHGRPGALKVGNSGTGGLHHVFAVILEQAAHVTVLHVPFKGGSEIVTALLGGQIDAASADTSALYAQVRSGKLRLLGLAAQSRHPLFPEVPTYAQQGLAVHIGVRRLVVAPRGTPAAIIAKLERAYLRAARDADFRKLEGGWVLDVKDARETAQAMVSDDDLLRSIVDRARLRVAQ